MVNSPVTVSSPVTASSLRPRRPRLVAPCRRPRRWRSRVRATPHVTRTSAIRRSASAPGLVKPPTIAKPARSAWRPCAFPQWAAEHSRQHSSTEDWAPLPSTKSLHKRTFRLSKRPS
jgi:hypothetical protein